MSQRLRRGQRIKKQRSFAAAIRLGRFYRGTLLNLWALRRQDACLAADAKRPPDESAPPCIGIIVSRKVDLSAVKRNLWKRRIREAFRKNQEKTAPGWALVIQAKKQARLPGYSEIEKEFLKLCQIARVMKKSRTD